ncbi:MAG: RsmE family RNA methyltransferase [Brevinematia bacterium]
MKMVFSNEKNNIIGNKIFISDPNDFKHLKKVQRIKIGEKLLFFDTERKIEFTCRVIGFQRNTIVLDMLDSKHINKSKPEIFVIQAIIQKRAFEDEVNRLSELGVDFLQPIVSKHSQNFSFDEKYLERLKKISLEGAKTVGNPFPLEVLNPISITKNFNDFRKLINNFEGKTKLLLFTNRVINGISFNLLEILRELEGSDRIAICVGSEGGFTEYEENEISSMGFLPVNLGKDILLRSDTVCIGVSFVLRLLRFSLS